jgi:serine O-acetyltransferase
VHEKAIIGKNCRIFQNVTIGAKWPVHKELDGVPVIEDNVQIGCGAAILGPVHIGANSVIGANAVVVMNIPPNAMAVGVPASVKEKKR